MNVSRKLLLSSLILLSLVISACGGLTRSDKPATKTWWLKPLSAATPESTPDEVKVLELSVNVVPGLDSDRILTLSTDAELNYYTAARWADNLPELIESLFTRSLQTSGKFSVRSKHGVVGHQNCNLSLEVREFFANVDPAGQSHEIQVSINGQYVCPSLAPKVIQLQATVPVRGERMSIIVAAFQQGIDAVLRDLLAQLEH